jgi:uncharacterized membrane protein SirB2
MSQEYLFVREIHLAAAAISFALFVLRGLWMMRDSPRLQRRWVRILPHVNDTVLLAAGIWLAFFLRQIPGVSAWLTAKLIALVVYIALGMIALRRGRTKRQRIAAWLGALAVFGYIVAVASTRNPLPWTVA